MILVEMSLGTMYTNIMSIMNKCIIYANLNLITPNGNPVILIEYIIITSILFNLYKYYTGVHYELLHLNAINTLKTINSYKERNSFKNYSF